MDMVERARAALASYRLEHVSREEVLVMLRAMREPTETQIDRFVSRALCVSVAGDGGWSEYARQQWQAMIDAALGEGK